MKTERRSKSRAKPSPPPSPDKNTHYPKINRFCPFCIIFALLPTKLGLVWFAIEVGTGFILIP